MGEKKIKTSTTQLEKVQAMSAKEFIDWFWRTGTCDICAYKHTDCHSSCENGMIKYMNAPVEGELF